MSQSTKMFIIECIHGSYTNLLNKHAMFKIFITDFNFEFLKIKTRSKYEKELNDKQT